MLEPKNEYFLCENEDAVALRSRDFWREIWHNTNQSTAAGMLALSLVFVVHIERYSRRHVH